MVVGSENLVLGRKKGARDICGTSRVWRKLLSMCCMGKEKNCLTLSDLTRSLPLAVLTPLRSITQALIDFFLFGHGASMAPFNAL